MYLVSFRSLVSPPILSTSLETVNWKFLSQSYRGHHLHCWQINVVQCAPVQCRRVTMRFQILQESHNVVPYISAESQCGPVYCIYCRRVTMWSRIYRESYNVDQYIAGESLYVVPYTHIVVLYIARESQCGTVYIGRVTMWSVNCMSHNVVPYVSAESRCGPVNCGRVGTNGN